MKDLFMFLSRKIYVKVWEHTPPEERFYVTVMKEDGSSPIDEKKISFIDVEEICWRNAYAIHSWFVQSYKQKGNEVDFPVEERKLIELQKIIDEILFNDKKANKLLPSPSNEYNAEYFEILRFTKDKLSEILSSGNFGDFYYSASL